MTTDSIRNAIRIYGNSTEVLRLSRDGIWANPDIPVDDAAKLVLAAMDSHIKVMVQRAVEAERERCAQVCEDGINAERYPSLAEVAHTIRSRGNQ